MECESTRCKCSFDDDKQEFVGIIVRVRCNVMVHTVKKLSSLCHQFPGVKTSERPKPIFLPIPKFRQFRYRQKGYRYRYRKSLHTDTETDTETERQIICKEMKPVIEEFF
jgi:hypothetical protein